MLDPTLEQLAREFGIGDAYENYRGQWTTIGPATRRAILAAMGLPVDDAEAMAEVERARERAGWCELLPPVAVVHPGRTGIEIAIAEDDLGRTLEWRVALEGGGEVRGEALAADLVESGRREIDGRCRTRRVLTLPPVLADGYHVLGAGFRGADRSECTLVAAPRSCHEPPALQAGRRLWGLSVQLYSLRSGGNWGIGDFADLEAMIRAFAPAQAAFVALNPLHAQFPGNPTHASPYSPSSRQFLNTLYVAVERVPEFAECDAARAVVAGEDFQAEVSRLRATADVDYASVSSIKLRVLRIVFAHFASAHLARSTARGRRFLEYVAERAEALRRHALHDAIDSYLRAQDPLRYWGWPSWPAELRDPASDAVRAFEAAHEEDVRFHGWLQWIAEEQLDGVQRLARELGMPIGLYGDYAVGVNPCGSETWSDQSLYRRGAGLGAPPDALALKGQDWGVPPQDPNVLRATAYAPFRRLVAAGMRHYGALRFDHIMALYRQWWVPAGTGAVEGGYVHYPLDDLMSVLALESERGRCLAVGEDLGTVPREVSVAMHERAVYSYRVLLFEKHGDGTFRRPNEYPRRSIATVTTHDLPTLAGYWSGNDIELRRALGLYPGEDVRQHLERERVHDRQSMLTALAAVGLWHAGGDATTTPCEEHLARAVHVYLARSEAALVAIQLEDLVGMTDPVNVPGTSHEHANWQRKMSCGLEELVARPDVRATLAAVQSARA
jgi:4-alpha-glucanotransferase